MIIGIPSEIHRHEHRVGLNPFGVSRLTQQGHTVLVEKGAGDAAHFTDQLYQKAGGQTVYTAEEVYKRSDLICAVHVMSMEDLELLKLDTTICAFQNLAVAPREMVTGLMEMKTTLIGYEVIRDDTGQLPVLSPFSDMAGQMAVHIAAYYLQTSAGGRGILMGNVPGVPPPTVVILGGGSVGRSAARQALASGAHVIVLDDDQRKLRAVNNEFAGQVVTVMAAMERLEQYTAIADVLIGAILIPGARVPFLVTEEMVQAMKPGSVIIDVSIDQGGCIETSRPTSLDDPTFVVHDVLHYCVPNLTANLPRTASRALANSALPYLSSIAGVGLDEALSEDPGLAQGVYIYRGKMVNKDAAEALRMSSTPLNQLMQQGAR